MIEGGDFFMRIRTELERTVTEAETFLASEGEFLTDGTKLALSDMIGRARDALSGCGVPFVRNREFYNPRENEALFFALERFTMAPTYLPNGSVYAKYGLRPALEWAKSQDMRYCGKEALKKKAEQALAQSEALLERTPRGKVPGGVPDSVRAELERAAEDLSKEALPQAECAVRVIRCLNAARKFRLSVYLRSDFEPGSNLFQSAEEAASFPQEVQADADAREQYQRIRRETDAVSLETARLLPRFQKEKTDYNLLNRYFHLWSSAEQNLNFAVPDDAAWAELRFSLPREDNEKDGVGHFWLDDVRVFAANGRDWPIRNPGFEETAGGVPAGWVPFAQSGSPVCKTENRSGYSGNGNRSVFVQNPTPQDEGGWKQENRIPVEGGGTCTITFRAKIDGKPKKGIRAEILFFDDRQQPCGQYVTFFRKKSCVSDIPFALTMQCDAIVYAFTGDLRYAEKAKLELLYVMNDFCQGAEYWMVENARPEGSDAYGAVQGGRILCSAAAAYTYLKGSGVVTDEEKRRFYRQLDYLLRYLLDLRDRTELSPEDAQRNCSNWQMDMCAGTGMMMMAVGDDFPNRRVWLANAVAVLRGQLGCNINSDGSWPESMRYQYSALGRFLIFAKALKNCTGEDWFRETGLCRLLSAPIDLQTPRYEFLGGVSTPDFGDHVMSNGSEFGIFSPYLSDVKQVDPGLADRAFLTWRRAGRPVPRLFTEDPAIQNLFLRCGSYRPETDSLTLPEACSCPDAGVYVFRKHACTPQESYFTVMSSPRPVGHGHLDQGSFMIWKNCVPIVLDSGVEGYFDGTVNWHLCSYSHACLQLEYRGAKAPRSGGGINLTAGTFSRDHGWLDVPRQSRVLSYHPDGPVKTLKIAIRYPNGCLHIREFFFFYDQEFYLIHDSVAGWTGRILFSLPIVASHSEIRENSVYSHGLFSIDLETHFLGGHPQIQMEKGRCAPMIPRNGKNCEMEYLRACATAPEGFTTVLYPKVRGTSGLMIERKGGKYLLTVSDSRFIIQTGEHFSVQIVS
jgi:hypothetical protein